MSIIQCQKKSKETVEGNKMWFIKTYSVKYQMNVIFCLEIEKHPNSLNMGKY